MLSNNVDTHQDGYNGIKAKENKKKAILCDDTAVKHPCKSKSPRESVQSKTPAGIPRMQQTSRRSLSHANTFTDNAKIHEDEKNSTDMSQ